MATTTTTAAAPSTTPPVAPAPTIAPAPVTTTTKSMFQASHDLADRKVDEQLASDGGAPTDPVDASPATAEGDSPWDRVVRLAGFTRTSAEAGRARATASFRQASDWMRDRPIEALAIGLGLGFLFASSSIGRR